MASWREKVLTLVEIGKCLEGLETALRRLNATAVVKDEAVPDIILNMRTAARKLVREIDSLSV